MNTSKSFQNPPWWANAKRWTKEDEEERRQALLDRGAGVGNEPTEEIDREVSIEGQGSTEVEANSDLEEPDTDEVPLNVGTD